MNIFYPLVVTLVLPSRLSIVIWTCHVSTVLHVILWVLWFQTLIVNNSFHDYCHGIELSELLTALGINQIYDILIDDCIWKWTLHSYLADK